MSPPAASTTRPPSTRGKSPSPKVEEREIELHGHRVSYKIAGDGPLVGLIHGITESAEVWRDVMPRLARHYTVVAGDLVGHGRSAKPRGDYSLGAYASGMRDLIGALGYESGTVVGRSLGGGIAMQFAYQYPEYTERMVLVSSGGLGRTVHPLLRAATLPGSELVLPLIAPRFAITAGETLGRALGRIGLHVRSDIAEMARGYASLNDSEARDAFRHTLRAVVDPGGQRVSALDRLYLAEDMPVLLLWGEKDPIIPAAHGRRAHKLIPDSRYVEFAGSGHWPQLDDPERFADTLIDFIETTEPYEFDLDRMKQQLREGPQKR